MMMSDIPLTPNASPTTYIASPRVRSYHKLLLISLPSVVGLPFYHWWHGAPTSDLRLNVLLVVVLLGASIATSNSAVDAYNRMLSLRLRLLMVGTLGVSMTFGPIALVLGLILAFGTIRAGPVGAPGAAAVTTTLATGAPPAATSSETINSIDEDDSPAPPPSLALAPHSIPLPPSPDVVLGYATAPGVPDTPRAPPASCCA
jgi:hypothetical protein